MKKLVALLLCAVAFLPTVAQASVAENEVCLVRHKHYGIDDDAYPYGAVFYVYAPTARGDFFRYTFACRSLHHYTFGTFSEEYFGIQHIGRGPVYQGTSHHIGTGEYDAINGFSLGGTTIHTTQRRLATADTHYLRYNVPGGYTPTHVRVYHQESIVTVFTIKFYNPTPEQVGDTTTITTEAADMDLVPTTWIAVPSGTSYVEIKYVSGTSVGVFGVDWINTGSEVDPDTYGALMFDGPNGDMLEITDPVVDGTTYWSFNEEEFGPLMYGDAGQGAGNEYIGTLVHGGIDDADTNALAVYTKTGDAEPVTWDPTDNDGTTTYNPDSGDARVVCDSVWIQMDGFDVYDRPEEQASEQVVASADIDISVNANGIRHRTRYDFTASVSYAQLMSFTWSMPRSPCKVRFWPEKDWRLYTGAANLEADDDQCTGVSLIYGENNTRVDIFNVPMYRRFGAANDRVLVVDGADTDIYGTSWLSSGNTYDVVNGSVLQFDTLYLFQDTEYDYYPSTREGSGTHYRGKH